MTLEVLQEKNSKILGEIRGISSKVDEIISHSVRIVNNSSCALQPIQYEEKTTEVVVVDTAAADKKKKAKKDQDKMTANSGLIAPVSFFVKKDEQEVKKESNPLYVQPAPFVSVQAEPSVPSDMTVGPQGQDMSKFTGTQTPIAGNGFTMIPEQAINYTGPVPENGDWEKTDPIFKKIEDALNGINVMVQFMPKGDLVTGYIFRVQDNDFDLMHSFTVDYKGIILNAKKKWFTNSGNLPNTGIEDSRMFSLDDDGIEILKAYVQGQDVSKYQQINADDYIALNRIVNMSSFPKKGVKNAGEVRLNITNRLINAMKQGLFADAKPTKNRYGFLMVKSADEFIIGNNQPFRYGYSVVSEPEQMITFKKGEAVYS